MDFAINVPGCVSNVVDGLNAAEKRYLKGEMETLGKLSSNNASKLECFTVHQYMFSLNL